MKNTRQILLVQPAVDTNLEFMSRNGIYPPLGLLSIATYLDFRFEEDLSISVIDLTVDAPPKLEELMGEADLVGVSVNSFNYDNSLEIARVAKENGAMTVLGGVHARALKKQILSKRYFIDFIVDGEGEETLYNLLHGTDKSQIPNLVYRGDNGRINENINIEMVLSDVPIINRKFLDMDKYFNNFQKQNPYHFPFSRPTSVYTHKGCTWRDKSGGCIFCARQDTCFKSRHHNDFWREIGYLKDTYEIDYVWNVADDVLGDIEWLKTTVKSRPNDIEVKFLNYARADSISSATISLLVEFNTHELVVGFETGDPYLIKTAQKGYEIDSNYAAMELLAEADLLLYPMFVLGLPGETTKTVRNTFRFIEALISRCNIARFVVSFLIPFPGSKAYNMLRDTYEQKYENTDLFLIDEAVGDWFRAFTVLESIDVVKERLEVFSKYGYYENELCRSKYSFEFVKRV